MPLGRPRIFSDEQRKLKNTLRNIMLRCSYPRVNQYHRYGGRGIRCRITFEELESIWKRDRAKNMVRPSIDRIDNDGDYTKDNCRFVEMLDNQDRNYKRCPKCKQNRTLSIRELCSVCKVRKKICRFCGKEYFTYKLGTGLCCKKCKYVTRPCVRCGKPVTRRNKVVYTRVQNWACCGKGNFASTHWKTRSK